MMLFVQNKMTESMRMTDQVNERIRQSGALWVRAGENNETEIETQNNEEETLEFI